MENRVVLTWEPRQPEAVRLQVFVFVELLHHVDQLSDPPPCLDGPTGGMGWGSIRGWNDGKVGKNIGQHLMSAQENHPFCTTK